MSDNTCDPGGGKSEGTGKRIVRRGFIGVLGGTGLAAAQALFGRPPEAAAAGCGCCNLIYCPPTVSMRNCRNAPHYIWGCSMSAYLHCSCCEKRRNGRYVASAYNCRYN